ncbi:MAG: hypothetical protein RMY28_009435 [Nostoc sp. ChiSLP01]|nr:hypothetical protein [Nostoc sp. CmiSLP01]MDZ8285223.1 hypothetical protein [Nostoc sp. ChiSLP01]
MLSGLKGGLISPTALSTPIYRRSPASGLKSGMVSSGDLSSKKKEPEQQDPYFNDVILLLKGIGDNNSTAILDSSNTNKSPNAVLGSPVISTARSKFDSSSIYFNNGSALDYVSPDFNFLGDFTIDFWFLSNNASQIINGDTLFDCRPDGANGNYPLVSIFTNRLTLYQNGGTQIQSSPILVNDVFYYAGLKRVENITELWLSGSLIGSYTAGIYSFSSRILIGGNAFRGVATDTYFDGYFSGFRVTNNNRDLSIVPAQAFPAN